MSRPDRATGMRQLGAPVAERDGVELTQCPYDGAAIEAELCSGGSLLVSCPTCAAVWEWHGAWIRRVREPDRNKLITVGATGAAIPQ